jgi:hypothetical protein
MSAVKVIRYLLANSAPLIAAVPAAKIMAGVIPIETVLPAIAVSHISTVEGNTVAMNGATVLATSRVQVTVQTKTYAEQESILELVRKACPVSRATINGVIVDSIIPDIAGPDFRDDEAGIFMRSRDFIVRFTEATT